MVNREWHARNKMPKNPSFDERARWHVSHDHNCSCRKESHKRLVDMKKKK